MKQHNKLYDVLLVDDEPGAIKSLKYLLDWEQAGFRIAGEASNGRQALECLAEHPYSFVITDIRMPEMEGLAFIAAVRERSDITVAIMSGYEDFAYARAALQLEVKDYLLKPAEEDDLARLLARVRGELDKRDKPVPSEEDRAAPSGDLGNEKGVARFVKQWVKDHYASPLTLKGIAAQLYMNPAYLGSLFKTQTGIGFGEYVLQVRMEKAKEILAGTDLKVYEVASAVGYNDMDWFYEKFKLYTGVNPRDYRSSRDSVG
ncbi:response regulator transcription factor [Cohnella fermenti]|uniref:response regulator transcription factor n=1 Tax=Cohnella fermenti TaxID=2565925 RepID=UPI001454C811|nr:response regulator [Cohnella fermenti]